jgi:hypothetical protein
MSNGPGGLGERRDWIFAGACYASVALLFTALYFRLTAPWSAADFAKYVGPPSQWPVEETTFRFRLLMPLVGRALTLATGINPEWIFKGLTFASVLLLLFFYRRYLTNFVAPKPAAVLAPALVYPLAWNFCLLNSLYFPFDMPSVLFFVMGCHFAYRRNWLAHYPTLVLAILNRETSVFLILIFALTVYGTMTPRRWLAHLVAQAIIWGGIKAIIFFAISGNPAVLTKSHLGYNLSVLGDMVRMRGNFLKDWGKLILAFGGAWLIVPWIFRRQPTYIKRTLLVIAPFIILSLLKGVIDEMRIYGELIPIVATPIVYWVAEGLGGTRPGSHAVPRPRAPESLTE